MRYSSQNLTGILTPSLTIKVEETEVPLIKITDIFSIQSTDTPYAMYTVKDNTFFYVDHSLIKKIDIENFTDVKKIIMSQVVNLGHVKDIKAFNALTETLVFPNIYSIFIESVKRTYLYSPTFVYKMLELKL